VVQYCSGKSVGGCLRERGAAGGRAGNDRSGAGASTGAESTSEEDRKHGPAAKPARSEGGEGR